MPKRRAPGFGSIRTTSAGRYQARYKTPDGRYRPGPHTFTTKRDAELFLATTRLEIEDGTYLDPAMRAVTLREYAADWLADRQLAPRTRLLYADLLRLHVLPELGDFPLRKVTPATVRRWHSNLVKRVQGRPPSQAYGLLRTIMNTAITDSLVRTNPCSVRGAGQYKSPERPLLSIADVTELTEAIDEYLRPLVTVTFWCHLRMGEVLGLQRDDVDLVARRLRVERQLVRVGSEWETTPPKAASRRTVDMPEQAVAVLRRHLAANPGLPNAPLFTRPDGARLRQWHVDAAWQRARAEVGLPRARFHDLRHGSLTLAAVVGGTLKEVMARAGHSTVAAAMNYQHNASHRGAEIADALSALGVAARQVPEADSGGTLAQEWHA